MMMKKRADDLIEEFFDTEHVKEAQQCAKEIKADMPAFVPEFVQRAIRKSLSFGPKEQGLVKKLFETLVAKRIVTSQELANGFQDAYGRLDDFVADCPHARKIMASIGKHCDEKRSFIKAELSAELAALVGREVAEQKDDVATDDVISKLLEGDKKGKALITHAKAVFADNEKPAGSAFLAAVLAKSAPLDAACAWTTEEEYGLLLNALLYGNEDEEPMKALFECQAAVHALGWPKGLLETIFMKLYQNECLDDEAFEAWKDDLSDAPGKMKAIVDVTGFLNFLAEQEAEEDSDEDEESDEE